MFHKLSKWSQWIFALIVFTLMIDDEYLLSKEITFDSLIYTPIWPQYSINSGLIVSILSFEEVQSSCRA